MGVLLYNTAHIVPSLIVTLALEVTSNLSNKKKNNNSVQNRLSFLEVKLISPEELRGLLFEFMRQKGLFPTTWRKVSL